MLCYRVMISVFQFLPFSRVPPRNLLQIPSNTAYLCYIMTSAIWTRSFSTVRTVCYSRVHLTSTSTRNNISFTHLYQRIMAHRTVPISVNISFINNKLTGKTFEAHTNIMCLHPMNNLPHHYYPSRRNLPYRRMYRELHPR